jgi:hypothetical protein
MSELLPFTDLPEPEPPKWREHSGAKWITDHPQEWEFAKHLIQEQLITNVLELARQIAVTFERWAHVLNADGTVKENTLGTLRNQITARIAAEFEPADIDRIDAMRARLARGAGIAKTHELIDKSNAKGDLGATSMATKLMSDIAAQTSGTPSVVKEVRVRVNLDELREQLKQRSALPQATVIDVVPLAVRDEIQVSNDES